MKTHLLDVNVLFALVWPAQEGIHGYRQWTDGYLSQTAVERGGVFVTFDSGVKEIATRESAGNLLVLKQR